MSPHHAVLDVLAARLAEGTGPDDRTGESEVLAGYGITRAQLIGSGGESEVFALDEHRVLRLYRRGHEASGPTINHLRGLYQGWQHADIGVELPLILSDHADWDELTDTLMEIAPKEVWVTHGREEALVHWCMTRQIKARPLHLAGFEDEDD